MPPKRDSTPPTPLRRLPRGRRSGRTAWEEDWSALADPALRTQPFGDLKYIPLFAGNPNSYRSLGMNLRERFESTRSPGFGFAAGGVRSDSYVLQRLEMFLDARLNENWQIYTQIEDARAFGKRTLLSADQNILDLRLAFVAYTQTGDIGTFKARAGRQDFAFDLQRFVSSRDGPNVRQSFDALWGDWEIGDWRVLVFVSQPVQYRFDRSFDDSSARDFRFSMLRAETKILDQQEVSAYYALYEREGAPLSTRAAASGGTHSICATQGVRGPSIGILRRWRRSAISAVPASEPGRSGVAPATRSPISHGNPALESKGMPHRATEGRGTAVWARSTHYSRTAIISPSAATRAMRISCT